MRSIADAPPLIPRTRTPLQNFNQPAGSTLTFEVDGSGQQGAAITLQGSGCAQLGGDAVVQFTQGAADQGEVTVALVSAQCIGSQFGSVTAVTEVEACARYEGPGTQQQTGAGLSATFEATDECDGSGLSTGALAGIIAGSVVTMGVIVALFVVARRR